ncbi:hypothetical protein HDU76_012936 [Blyttiomyces sp. JEL0837]|nr:hypothetical protein HDU76_012936 [Blyttiomyces sp. JEL0837]
MQIPITSSQSSSSSSSSSSHPHESQTGLPQPTAPPMYSLIDDDQSVHSDALQDHPPAPPPPTTSASAPAYTPSAPPPPHESNSILIPLPPPLTPPPVINQLFIRSILQDHIRKTWLLSNQTISTALADTFLDFTPAKECCIESVHSYSVWTVTTKSLIETRTVVTEKVPNRGRNAKVVPVIVPIGERGFDPTWVLLVDGANANDLWTYPINMDGLKAWYDVDDDFIIDEVDDDDEGTLGVIVRNVFREKGKKGKKSKYEYEAGRRFDNNGVDPDTWRVGEVSVELPGTRTIETCSKCAAVGYRPCHECHSSGKELCRRCDGDGKVRDKKGGHDSDDRSGKKTCHHCHGKGKTACSVCDGEGSVVSALKLKMKRSVSTGTRVFLKELNPSTGKFTTVSVEGITDEKVISKVPMTPVWSDGETQQPEASASSTHIQPRIQAPTIHIPAHQPHSSAIDLQDILAALTNLTNQPAPGRGRITDSNKVSKTVARFATVSVGCLHKVHLVYEDRRTRNRHSFDMFVAEEGGEAGTTTRPGGIELVHVNGYPSATAYWNLGATVAAVAVVAASVIGWMVAG